MAQPRGIWVEDIKEGNQIIEPLRERLLGRFPVDDIVNPETGEVMDIDRLEKLNMAKAEKVDNIACWVKNLEADVAAFEATGKGFC